MPCFEQFMHGFIINYLTMTRIYFNEKLLVKSIYIKEKAKHAGTAYFELYIVNI